MATFAITAAKAWDDAAFSTRAGNDTYNINGGSLTIDSDTRYCANSDATKGAMGSLVISGSLGGAVTIDGTKVRLIPFDTGSGNVPAIGATISQGSVSGPLLGVWSALNVPPTAAGSAMPASGYIKIRAVTGGAYSAGALTGIGANATGADIVGWIEVVGVETKYISVPRLGTFTAQGAWFDLGTTSGAANQTVQLPASLGNTYYPGIYVETSVGSGVYEFWPNILPVVRATTPTDKRGKVCWISAGGLLRIGNNGTNTVGFVPAAGCKMRVPNIVTINAASASLSVNAVPNAALLSRYTFSTSGQGSLVFDKCNLAWYPGLTTPFSVVMTDTAWLDALYLIRPYSNNASFTRCGNGVTNVASNIALRVEGATAGSTITDCTFVGRDGSSFALYLNVAKFLTVVRTKGMLVQPRTSGANYPWALACSDSTFTDCVSIGGKIPVGSASSNCKFTNTHLVDSFEGTTNTSVPAHGFDIGACRDLTVDGVDFWGLTNVHPAYYLFNLTDSVNTKIRNIGTFAAPLDLGSLAKVDIVVVYGGTYNLSVQRVYTINYTSYKYYGATSANGTTLENYTTTFTGMGIPELGQNVVMKGIGGVLSSTATGTPGYCFGDCFSSATTGYFVWLMNEQTADIRSAGSYVATGNAKFTGSGGLVMPTVGDSIEWTTPYYVLGHTGFANTAPVFVGPTATNFTRTYSLDKNDGNGFGAYKTCTAANLSAETGIDASKGFKMKLKIVTTVANADRLDNLYITTTSTSTAQAYQYPLDTNLLTLTGIPAGSEVRCYTGAKDGSAVEIGGIESTSDSSFSFTHSSGGAAGFIHIIHPNYKIKEIDYTYVTSDTTLLIQMDADQWYSNPA